MSGVVGALHEGFTPLKCCRGCGGFRPPGEGHRPPGAWTVRSCLPGVTHEPSRDAEQREWAHTGQDAMSGHQASEDAAELRAGQWAESWAWA